MTDERRDQIDRRWKEIDTRLERVRETGLSPVPGVDPEFYRDQLLAELDELEYEVGVDYFDKRP